MSESQETRQLRSTIERHVESIRPASAGGGYSSKSVGEAVDRIMTLFEAARIRGFDAGKEAAANELDTAAEVIRDDTDDHHRRMSHDAARHGVELEMQWRYFAARIRALAAPQEG